MARRATTKVNSTQGRTLGTLVFLVLALSSLYIYFVSKSIINVIVREEMRQEMATLNSIIGDLESKYIVSKNEIDIHFAYAQGFVDLSGKTFVARNSLVAAELTFNNESR